MKVDFTTNDSSSSLNVLEDENIQRVNKVDEPLAYIINGHIQMVITAVVNLAVIL